MQTRSMIETTCLNDEKPQDDLPQGLLKREETVGAGLDQLDVITEKLVRHRESSVDAADLPSRKPSEGISLVDAALVLICGAIGNAALEGPSSKHLVAFLVLLAVLLLGTTNVGPIGRDLVKRKGTVLNRVPLTDKTYTIKTLNVLANSAQCREKGLKILQYVLRGASYLDVTPWSKQLKSLSKSTSIARRFFKFCRWVKHFEDINEAKSQTGVMKLFLMVRIAANFGADWAEDVCSLERMGFLPSGTLSVEFLLFAEYCQLVLAIVEVVVTKARESKEKHVFDLARSVGASPSELTKLRRKCAMVRLEMCKFVSDLGKAFYDCELAFAHEGVFIGCALFSALLSTHKNMVKVLK